jgi:hypothetical protein
MDHFTLPLNHMQKLCHVVMLESRRHSSSALVATGRRKSGNSLSSTTDSISVAADAWKLAAANLLAFCHLSIQFIVSPFCCICWRLGSR